jgi:DUF1009 family protein
VTIGIICGGGDYPRLIAKTCIEKNIDFCLLFINGCTDIFPQTLYNDLLYPECSMPALTINLGEIETAIDFFKTNNVDKIIFAGHIKRPNFKDLSLDKKGASWLLKLGKAIFSGDDALLRAIVKLLNDDGFEIISGTDLIDDVFVSAGILTSKAPSDSEYFDIKKGFQAAKTLGALDIGQSVIVHDGLILGVECIEGTDNLIERCADLRKSSTGGILVKASKPEQDKRLDLPTIGVNTINLLKKHEFSGVAIEAEKCIVLNKKLVIEQANDFSMFFIAVNYDLNM